MCQKWHGIPIVIFLNEERNENTAEKNSCYSKQKQRPKP